MDSGILDTHARVVFFPVRHHSPACSRCLVDLMRRIRPSTVLIEGPSDFNNRISELVLPHELPMAIYSYFELADPAGHLPTARAGAFYPFCVYSPEWQALTVATELGAECRFIDSPFCDVARWDRTANRYADAEMRRSAYVDALCRELGVEGLDGLWDTMFEIDPNLGLEEFLRRCHTFCYNMRLTDRFASPVDLAREAFMADQITDACAGASGPVLVVTGGYHSFALYARVHGLAFSGNRPAPDDSDGAIGAPARPASDDDHGAEEQAVVGSRDCYPFPGLSRGAGDQAPVFARRGIALTPYSYARLDSLTGYDSGMPNPGFYHQAWMNRGDAPRDVYRILIAQAVAALRGRGQVASTADVIALDTVASALAALRGHARVWRSDVIDGVIGALIKDELAIGGSHPMLDAVHAVFRGDVRGVLAAGTVLPPLVHDIERLLRDHDLTPLPTHRKARIELGPDGEGRAGIVKSRVLHALRVLGIPGFTRTGGVDFARRDDMLHLWEEWTTVWTPEFDAACIEASVYGGTLADAGLARLRERVATAGRDAESAALILLDACLMGAELTADLRDGLAAVIRTDARFFGVTRALGHLLYLYKYDEALGVGGDIAVGALVRETFERCLWLLETIGQPQGMDREILDGVRTLVEAFERCQPYRAGEVVLPGDELLSILDRIGSDPAQSPLLRGAARGAQWTLGELVIKLTYYTYQGKGDAPTIPPLAEDQVIERATHVSRLVGDPPLDTLHPLGEGPGMRVATQGGPGLRPDVLLSDMVACGEPSRLGDFLTGLFHLARETAQRQPELMAAVDRLVMAYDDDDYLESLPSLRLAFSYFAPREKHHLARTLLRTLGIDDDAPLPALTVSVEDAAAAMAFETRLYVALDRYGIRGGHCGPH